MKRTAYINCVDAGRGIYNIWLKQKKRKNPGMAVVHFQTYGTDAFRCSTVFVDLPLPKEGDDIKLAETLKEKFGFDSVFLVKVRPNAEEAWSRAFTDEAINANELFIEEEAA